jgi:hypothetical protein
MINVELLTEVQGARDVGDVVKAINRLAKPYGDVRAWRFYRDRDGRRLHVYVSLDDTDQHAALAGRLGGTVSGEEVCFIVPLYLTFDQTSPLAVSRFIDQPPPRAEEQAASHA